MRTTKHFAPAAAGAAAVVTTAYLAPEIRARHAPLPRSRIDWCPQSSHSHHPWHPGSERNSRWTPRAQRTAHQDTKAMMTRRHHRAGQHSTHPQGYHNLGGTTEWCSTATSTKICIPGMKPGIHRAATVPLKPHMQPRLEPHPSCQGHPHTSMVFSTRPTEPLDTSHTMSTPSEPPVTSSVLLARRHMALTPCSHTRSHRHEGPWTRLDPTVHMK